MWKWSAQLHPFIAPFVSPKPYMYCGRISFTFSLIVSPGFLEETLRLYSTTYYVCMLRIWYCNCAGTGSLIWLWWSDVFCSLYPYKEAKDRRGNEIKLNVFSIVCFGVLLAVDVNYYMDEDEGKEERLAGWLAGWLARSPGIIFIFIQLIFCFASLCIMWKWWRRLRLVVVRCSFTIRCSF